MNVRRTQQISSTFSHVNWPWCGRIIRWTSGSPSREGVLLRAWGMLLAVCVQGGRAC